MKNPEKKSNKILRITIKNIIKFFLIILFRVKVIGQENVPEGACIICPNHISNWDPPVMVACSKRKINMMAKDSLFKNSLIRWLAKIFGIFPVKRGMKDLEAIKTSLKILKNDEALGIYPEGTRNGLAKGVKPKNGAVLIAIKAKVPIVPVGIQGKFKLFRKIKVNYGKPIYFDDQKIDIQNREQIDELTDNLMKEIIRLTNEKI